jgi:hypothetical protein
MSATMAAQSHAEPQRPRASTHFSFRSDRSNELSPTKSRTSKHERKVSDSERRKTHYDPTTKANPNAAMNEAQPSMFLSTRSHCRPARSGVPNAVGMPC